MTPPLDPSDERRHIHRAYVLSEGHLLPVGRTAGYRHTFPRSLSELHPPYDYVGPDGKPARRLQPGVHSVCSHSVGELLGRLDTSLEPDDRIRVSRPLPYGPVAYAPQAAALWVGRALGLSAGALLYVGRLATLAVWIPLCALAIRVAPIRRWTLVLLCLTPMSIFGASFLSADAVTNALSLLLCAWVLRAAFGPGNVLSSRDGWVLVGLGALLGAVKPGPWLLVALGLLIPAERFRDGRHRLAVLGGAAGAMVACTGLWVLALRIAGTPTYSPDPLLQAWLLVSQPGHFIEVLINTASEFGGGIVAGFVGILGHHDVQLPSAVYFAFPIVLLGVSLCDGPDPPALRGWRRAGFAAVAVGGGLCVLALLYVGASTPDAIYLNGIQGRHFIPLAPALVIAIPGRWALAVTWRAAVVTVFGVAMLGLGAHALLTHYFPGF